MQPDQVTLPPPANVGISIVYGREGKRLYAEATVLTPEGRITARMYPPHGVPQLFGKDSDIENWLHSTACRAVESVLMQVLPHTQRYTELAQQQRRDRIARVSQKLLQELEEHADD